jgi:hypothetical protein
MSWETLSLVNTSVVKTVTVCQLGGFQGGRSFVMEETSLFTFVDPHYTLVQSLTEQRAKRLNSAAIAPTHCIWVYRGTS